ncbi:transcriptional regulator Spx [Gottfriedia solisilvae]|uniref:ArsR family transcriptional regulator n=1 Tax=Gottfriedia solisilvae TaxID=1516104 RepID=A0A8J3AST6_9BACI|nr:transcriptional regulator Spx [Gottfriedia solisilvae]GGI18015.1 ArsR family transcriptional regulator [Gottfriedia solisilvae]
MIILYHTNTRSCKKAKKWLEMHNISYVDRNIHVKHLSVEEIISILRTNDTGTEGLISTRSAVFQKLKIDLNTIPLKELIGLIHEHSDLIRTPIILDHKRINVGFKEDDIRCFLPRNLRMIEFEKQIKNLLQLN